MRLPAPRGPMTAALFDRLGRRPGEVHLPPVAPAPEQALHDDDLQLALFACYELHYRGFEGADER
ncbi:hypothetical protein [Nonomuraea zeae]|uniref:hypothetical protein n=1 Tax=Nonomuraea zeae TaxID=1642303 RepID=UPI001F0F3E8D|nr:hypothetical protein [Nonomuraea zeae]